MITAPRTSSFCRSVAHAGPAASRTWVALAAALCCTGAAARPPSAPAADNRQAIVKNIALTDIVAGKGGGFVINGPAQRLAFSGASVAGAGDINGDGLDDVIIGAPGDGSGSYPNRVGAAYVVFGKPDTQTIDLAAVAAGQGGFVIHGAGTNYGTGQAVAAAGDVNGDGLADLLIGNGTEFGNDQPASHCYVVFGKADTNPVELSALAAGQGGGFAIHAASPTTVSGFNVAPAGDYNGDGIVDIAVGMRYDRLGNDGSSRNYVVFGKAGASPIELSAVAQGDGGVVINSEVHHGSSAISGVGDVNGDGLADLAIGAPGLNGGAGRSYVVFGRPGTAPIELAAVASGDGGFKLDGWDEYDASGSVVAAAGDMNGDGLADVLITAPADYWKYGRFAMGVTYVIFGRKTTEPVVLRDIEQGLGNGFAIYGESVRYDYSGKSAASIGDINGDGLSDLIIGAPGADSEPPTDGYYGGRAYVVYGKTDSTLLRLSYITGGATDGVTIFSEGHYGAMGTGGSGAGDVNGDGLPDLIVGAPERDLPGADSAGRSYVVFGGTRGTFAPTKFDQIGTPGNDALTGSERRESMTGGAGNDTLIGNGGADVLYGGPGDDTIVLDASNVKALRSPFGSGGNRQQLARVEGGAGFDTLGLAGANVTLDLRSVSSQGMSMPGNASRIESIERIDLTGDGDNTVRVGVADVQDMTGMNLINAANQAALGWTNGSYQFPAVTRRHQLVVDGNAGDSLGALFADWKDMGTVLHHGQTYTVWNSIGGRAQMLMNQQVQPIAYAPH